MSGLLPTDHTCSGSWFAWGQNYWYAFRADRARVSEAARRTARKEAARG